MSKFQTRKATVPLTHLRTEYQVFLWSNKGQVISKWVDYNPIGYTHCFKTEKAVLKCKQKELAIELKETQKAYENRIKRLKTDIITVNKMLKNLK